MHGFFLTLPKWEYFHIFAFPFCSQVSEFSEVHGISMVSSSPCLDGSTSISLPFALVSLVR